MPGCRTCYEAYLRGEQGGVSKAWWVAAGTTREQGERGEGLFCEEHKPEGAIDIFEWQDQEGA